MKRVKQIIGTCARTLLALTFIFSGVVKAIDPLGTTYKIEDYLKAFGGFFTDLLPLAETAAIALITVEFVLGICLLLNVGSKITSWLTLLFYLVMTPLTLYIALKNPVSDCGCFGDALVLTNWQTFWKNIVLLVLVALWLSTKKTLRAWFLPVAEIGVASLSAVAVVAFMAWTLNHLPVADFRPYAVGNNIPSLMEYPEDAEPDEYEITLIYAKDGVEQAFTLQDYPKGDSTWTFVDQQSKLIKKGYEPPIHDFEILNMDYEDLTYDILESETPVSLVVMYDLEKADLKQMSKVTQLMHTCMARGELFYILTGSGEQTINDFCFNIAINATSNELTPFNHPAQFFCTCDPVTLKTIVRANPGVIVVQNGNIIDKYNIKNR